MNTLELRWGESSNRLGASKKQPSASDKQKPSASRLQVLIDGTLLTQRLQAIERAQGYHPFNDDFLLPADVDWYSRNSWLRSASGESTRLVLLGCTCGDVDCSNLYADTLCQSGWILWRFGGWPERDYRGLGNFWFEQTAYRQQVERIFMHEGVL